jgi:hypothetical protein
MCDWVKSGNQRIDPCMREMVAIASTRVIGLKTLACCCGHGRYTATMVVRLPTGEAFEFFSKKIIPRKRRFYLKDANGYYYIPEVDQRKISPITKS